MEEIVVAVDRRGQLRKQDPRVSGENRDCYAFHVESGD